MRSKLIHIFTGIFILLAFVQCGDSITPIVEKPGQELSQTQLLTPENGSLKSTSLSFDWHKVEAARSYQIQLSTTEDFSSPLVDGTSDSTTFKVTALPGDATIFWKVRPVLNDKKGPWSKTFMFTTTAAPDSTEGITISAQSPENGATKVFTDVMLRWTTVATASAYNVQVATDQNFSTIVAEQEVQDATFSTSGLSTKTTYYWRVKPVVESQETKWSAVYSFTTGTRAAASVALSSPSNQASDQPTTLTLKWQEESSMDVYQVQVAADNSFSSPVIDEMVSEASYKVTGLESNQTYYWRVQVSADENDANWSEVREFKTKAGISEPPATSTKGIVSVSNGDFMLNGEVFRFAGTNAYYLHSYEKIDPQFVTESFEAFEEAGITVVRMWAFYDGYDCGWSAKDPSENVIQTAPGEYSEEALKDLDSVIAKAKNHGIRLVLTFVNYWDELGGICAYNTWDGAANPSINMKHFINDPDTQRWFKNYIKMLTNRVNTVTGVAYKNSPAIFSWEIINEARLEAQGSDPQVLRDWYQEIARFIKSQDPNHMVSTGSEGQEVGMAGSDSPYSVDQYSNTYILRAGGGTSYKVNTAIPEIDYGTAHWYPNGWGFGSSISESMLQAQRAWISDHIKIAEEMNKPFVLGEYGYDQGWGGNDALQIYKDLWSQAEEVELDGSLIWQLTTDYIKCYEYGGNICWPAGRQDADLYNAFKTHIEVMDSSR